MDLYRKSLKIENFLLKIISIARRIILTVYSKMLLRQRICESKDKKERVMYAYL